MTKPKGERKAYGKSSLRSKFRNATEAFEDALKSNPLKRAKYILRLYVCGSSARSLKAISNLKKICDEHLPDYDLEIIDIYTNPTAARAERIVAVPTLVKQLPEPLRRMVGDLSNTQKILIGLDVYKRQDTGKRLSNAT